MLSVALPTELRLLAQPGGTRTHALQFSGNPHLPTRDTMHSSRRTQPCLESDLCTKQKSTRLGEVYSFIIDRVADNFVERIVVVLPLHHILLA
jgi:hypothetical protein